MKKILLTFLLFFSLGFAASAETYEWTISSSDKSATTAKFNLILNNVTWSATHKSNGSSLHSQREGTEDIVFGSKNNSFNSLTLEAKAPFTNKKIESVSVTAWGGSKANISVSVYVNDVMVGNTQTLASAAATYDFSSVETLGENGTLKIEFTNSNSNNESNNTLKLSGLKVVYSEAQGGDTPDPTPDTPVISAATGDVVYAEGETASNEVVKGTEVSFSVSNYTEVLATFGEVMLDADDFVDGTYTATITADVKVTIIAYNGDTNATHVYNFTVKEETVDPTPNPAKGEWKLVTNVTELSAGDLLIIVNTEAGKAMATDVKDNNISASDVTIADGLLTFETEPLILQLGGSADKWTFSTTNYAATTQGYLSCASTSKKSYLRVKDTAETATISISGSDAAIKYNYTTSTRNIIRYNHNGGAPLFNCYASGQEPVQIFKFYEAKEEPEFELVGISHNPHFNKTNVVYSYTLHVNNHIEGRDSYEAVLTVNGQDFRNTEHTLATDATAESAMLREQTFNSTHKLNGIVKATGLDGDTKYAANFAVLHNGTEIYNEPVENFKTGTVGIEDVTVDGNEAAEYFNLQGVRVAQPEAGRVYIVRRGAKATKELVK